MADADAVRRGREVQQRLRDDFSHAGAELLRAHKAAAAVVPVPGTVPQAYAVAGEPSEIRKVLDGLQATSAPKVPRRCHYVPHKICWRLRRTWRLR
jgi:hypothetical protein